jgi:hypothetical protein
MTKALFTNIDYINDPHWIVKEFFNSIHGQELFLEFKRAWLDIVFRSASPKKHSSLSYPGFHGHF